MHSFSALTLIQVLLVVFGLLFQVIAMSWLYRDSSTDRSDGRHDGRGQRKIDLGMRRRHAVHTPTREAVHDYYEIEKTPNGVRPADLRKTARVTYMDNVNTPKLEE